MGNPDQHGLDLDALAAAIEESKRQEAEMAEKLRKALEE